jgi:hypothetical protein
MLLGKIVHSMAVPHGEVGTGNLDLGKAKAGIGKNQSGKRELKYK